MLLRIFLNNLFTKYTKGYVYCMLVNTIQSYLCIRTHTRPCTVCIFFCIQIHFIVTYIQIHFHRNSIHWYQCQDFTMALKGHQWHASCRPPPRVHKGYMFKDDFFGWHLSRRNISPVSETIKNVNPIPCQTFKYLLYTVTTVFIRLKILLICMLPFCP